MFQIASRGEFLVHLVHNERTKLTATWFNTLASAFVAAGLFAPLAAAIYGLAELRIGTGFVLGVILVCVTGGLFLHLIGRRFLGSLRE
jgi:hypothetical protein